MIRLPRRIWSKVLRGRGEMPCVCGVVCVHCITSLLRKVSERCVVISDLVKRLRRSDVFDSQLIFFFFFINNVLYL